MARAMRRGMTMRSLAAVVALTTLAFLPGQNTAGAAWAQRPAAVWTPPAPPAAAARTIDNASRSSVRQAYLSVLAPALAVPIGWTGNLASCSPGTPSADAQDATLVAVNYFREMAGLPPVTFDATYSAQAQAAALMMVAEDDLSHSPGTGWACYTAAGATGASKSNLALGITGAAAVQGYMRDPGAGNTSVGHRRWILHPPRTTMGSGSVDTGPPEHRRANALYVLGPQGPRPPGAPTWVPWPTSGYFPAQLEPGGRWSLTRQGADFSGATVTVTRGGTSLPVTVHPVVDGYGDNTLVWQVDPGYALGGADRPYTVTVSGIGTGGGTVDHTYTVTLFDATVAPPGPPTGASAVAGTKQATVSWSAPVDTGGSPVTGYTVTASPGGQTCTTAASPRTCTVTGLTNGAPYTFTVRARNAIGTGPPSAATAPITPSGDRCGPGLSGPFSDVGGTHLFCTDIQWLVNEAITGGYADGTFGPTLPVSRGAMAAFLWRLAGSPPNEPPPVASFPDVGPAHPFFAEVEWLADQAVTGGYPDGTFRPGAPVTRGSMAAFLHRFGGRPAFDPPAAGSFDDVGPTHPFFTEIEWLADRGVTGGYDDRTYRPSVDVSRQAMAAFLHRWAEG